MKSVKVVNKYTAEIHEYQWDSDLDLANAYQNIGETIKALERARAKLREQVLLSMGDEDKLEVGKFATWRRVVRQYLNYDPYLLQNKVQPDTFIDLVKPSKTKVDAYLKEAMETGELAKDDIKELRNTMIEERNPTEVLILERSK